MPKAPRKPCRYPGCGILTEGSYCGDHTKKAEVKKVEQRIKYDNERGTAHSRGYTSKWSKAAKIFLSNNPLCAACLKIGKLEVAECVDHIKPVSGPDDPLFWDETNWQSLSNTCHSIKTASENQGFGNSRKDRFL